MRSAARGAKLWALRSKGPHSLTRESPGPAADDSVQLWCDRMLDAFGGAGRKAVGYAV